MQNSRTKPIKSMSSLIQQITMCNKYLFKISLTDRKIIIFIVFQPKRINRFARI